MNIEEYQNALLAFGVRSTEGVDAVYWVKMFSWIKKYEDSAQNKLDQLRKKFESKLALTSLNHTDLKVLGLLLKQPVVDSNILKAKFRIQSSYLGQTVDKLIATDILTPFKLKRTNQKEILVCKDVCEFFTELDDSLFIGKGI